MISFKRSLLRPHQQVVLVAWALVFCTWIYVSFQKTTLFGSALRSGGFDSVEGTLARWVRHEKQEPIHSHPEHGDDNISHSRLMHRPLPGHASEAGISDVSVQAHLPADDGSHITEEEVDQYITNIWDLTDSRFWRTECDGQGRLPKRYTFLRDLANEHHTSEVKYFFALDLYQVRNLLPRLMGSLVDVVKMLGPTKCAVSVVEGRSNDGTYAILLALKEKLESMGTRFYLEQSDINPKAPGVDRIGALSELRNLALEPLVAQSKTSAGPPVYNHETVIVFINDIAVCTEDIYELLFQHVFQEAHQTCAMDWVQGGDLFYDSWVSRSMSGDLFFEVPQDVSFYYAQNLFWDHPPTKHKYHNRQPFQVYSCWGGMVTLNAAPFVSGQIAIRNSTRDECYAGEPITLAKDLWKLGYGRILTVPTVNVGYSSPESSRIKKRKGWVHTHVPIDWTEDEWRGTELVEWKTTPPGQVKCMPDWGIVSWTDP